MDITTMQERALGLADLFDRLNTLRGQAIWTASDLTLGLDAAFEATMTSLEEQVRAQVITAEATRP